MTQAMRQVMGVSGVTFLLDQLSKFWLLYGVGMMERRLISCGEYFDLVMVWNKGVSFGMFSRTGSDDAAYALIVLAVVVSFFLLRAALASPQFWERFCYAIIIGGALGNAFDRVYYGAVADFFSVHVGSYTWPAFNVADMAICIGVSLLLLRLVRDSKVKA